MPAAVSFPITARLLRRTAQRRFEQVRRGTPGSAGRDRDPGHEPDGDGVGSAPVLIRAARAERHPHARNLATEGAQIRGAVVSALSPYYFKKSPWTGDANDF
jgi:hypothetical protein